MRYGVMAALAATVLAPAPAAAVTVQVTGSGNRDFTTSLWTDTIQFNLPANYTNARLNITDFGADDRAIAELNGALIDSTGIFGPGDGAFRRVGGDNLPFSFPRGNGARDVTVLSPFTTGINTILITVNDTGDGIRGDLTTFTGPTGYSFTGTLTYDIAGTGVPEPATWAMMVLGVGAAGGALRRRRAITTKVAFAG